jgi:hypothetical protein
LKSSRVSVSPENLRFLGDLLPDMQAENDLWFCLVNMPFSWKETLRILGWDPQGARCALCRHPALWFFIPRQEFLCDSCVSKMGKSKLSYIRVDPSDKPKHHL